MPAFIPLQVDRAACIRWLAVALLLFNVVLGAALPSVARAQEASFPDAARSIVVCTAAGMVILDLGGQPGGQAAEHSYLCTFCMPLMHGGVVLSSPATAVLAIFPPPQALAAWPDEHRPASASLLAGSIVPRAPPPVI